MIVELLIAFVFFIGIVYVLSRFGFNLQTNLSIVAGLSPVWKSTLFTTVSLSLIITNLPFNGFIWYNIDPVLLLSFWIIPGIVFGYLISRPKTTFISILIESILLAYLYGLMIQQYFTADWILLSIAEQFDLMLNIYLRSILIGISTGFASLFGGYIRKYQTHRTDMNLANYDLSPINRQCPNCGAIIHSNARFCAVCGEELS